MKETNRAKNTISEIKIAGDPVDIERGLTHRQCCERFLDFLENLDKEFCVEGYGERMSNAELELYSNKIKDLEQAIKLYKEAKI